MDPRTEARLDEFLGEWTEDRKEGRTMRRLHQRLDDHQGDDDRRFADLEGKQRQLELGRAHDDGFNQGTGRFTVPKKRDSLPPWAKSPIARGVTKGILLLGLAFAGWLTRHLQEPPVGAPVPTAAATSSTAK